MEFTSLHNEMSWVLTCVYGPCTTEGKGLFLNWLKNIEIPAYVNWLVLGDFNLIRRQENRNRPRGNIAHMFLFNEVISHQGWSEIPLQGRKFTWSNMQPSPLLEKIDWVFTSKCWSLSFPIEIHGYGSF